MATVDPADIGLDAGDPGDEDMTGPALTAEQQAELEKLAARNAAGNNGNTGGVKPPRDLNALVAAKRAGKAPAPKAAKAGATAPTAEPATSSSAGDAGAAASGSEASGDPVDDFFAEIPGLTSTPQTTGTGAGGTAYDKRQAELAAAKANATKGKKASGKGKAKAKSKAAPKAKTEKQIEAEATRKAKAEADKKEKAEKEKQRKADIEAKRKEKAAARALARTPSVIAKENKAIQAMFAEDYKLAGPKTDRNPEGTGLRRAKADRGDVAAGYVMALRRVKQMQAAQKAKAGTPGAGAAGGQ